jgi:enoyl-CoA hydratase/carnithine racemase
MQETRDAIVTRDWGAIRLLTLNRPAKLNTFTPALLSALDAAVDAAAADAGVRVLAITGAGERAFSAGNDVDELSRMDGMQAYRCMRAGQGILGRLHDLGKPTIAMVNGYALGGGFELALACDFIIAAESAHFGFPEITLDTIPGWGGTQLAVARLGMARAKHMIMTGRHFAAGECRDAGFVHRVVPAAGLLDAVLSLGGALAGHDPFALEMAKRSLNRALEVPLGAGFDLEAAHYAVNFSAGRGGEGVQAYTARRAAAASARRAAIAKDEHGPLA